MISVKLLGGSQKIFGTDMMSVGLDGITIGQLLEHLLSIKPTNTQDLDTKNILVAVNGIDSSALQGHSTVLHAGDIVSIIPIIHGGSKRQQLQIGGKSIELYNIVHRKGKNYAFLDNLRKKFHDLTITGISPKNIASLSHVKKIVRLSLYAQKHDLLLSKKIETDVLLRFAATTQISLAIKILGIEKQDEFTIIAMGTKSSLSKLHDHLRQHLKEINYAENHSHIKKQFNISKKHLSSITTKTPLEDLIVERAAVLVQ